MSSSLDEFAAPAASTGVKWEDHLGALILFDVKSQEKAVRTSFGEKDAIRADVTIIEGAGAPADYPDALVFPLVMQGQLRPSIGKKVLGRLTQGIATPGQKPPWKITEATEQDKATARAFLAQNKAAASTPPF